MNSKHLLNQVGIECDENREIRQIVRYAHMACMFSVYVDVYEDSQQYIELALKKGALVITEKEIEGCYIIDNARRTLTDLVQILYGFPHQKMKMIGVTGTCGKSTMVHLIRSCLKDQKKECLCVMTHQVLVRDEVILTHNTTPDALFLIPLMSKCLDEGIDTVVMEISSEAYVLWRTEGYRFDVLIGTMIASDHLDTHQNLENYHLIKKKILSLSKPDGVVLLNEDDAVLSSMKSDLPGYVMTYGQSSSDFRFTDVQLSLSGSSFCFQNRNIKTKLLSLANVYHLVAAMCCGFVLDLKFECMLQWCEEVSGCPGRFEVVHTSPMIMIDYAHTQKAMEHVLSFLRSVSDRRIICVFGCGGHRDKSKRPLMGKTACMYSDVIIVTSDNPRDEDPVKIINEICEGCDKEVVVEVDRVKAIEMALTMSTKNDIIVLIGKGDETSTFSKGEMIPYSDRDIVRRYLKEDKLWEMCFLCLH